jgi:hypothetical protein
MQHGIYVRPRLCHVTHRLGYDMPHMLGIGYAMWHLGKAYDMPHMLGLGHAMWHIS